MLLANMFSVMLLSAALWSGQGARDRDRDVGRHLRIAVSELRLLGLPAHDPRFIYVSGRSRRGDEGARRRVVFDQRVFFSRTSVDTLTTVLMSPLLSLIYYFAAGLRPSDVGWHLLTLFLNSLCAHSRDCASWRGS